MELEKIHRIGKNTLDKKGHSYTSHRIIHDSKQITNPSQLKQGKTYQRMTNLEGKTIPKEKFTFLEQIDNRKIKIRKEDSEKNSYEVKALLADMAIIPYSTPDGGKWNANHYIIPIEE